MDAITYKPHGIMITQEYTTTLDAIRERLESGNIDRIEVSLKGFNVKTESVDDIRGLDVYDGSQRLKVREHRHHVSDDRFEESRTVTVHQDGAEAADGTLY